MKNYLDKKCTYGYMTVCDSCKDKVPSHVDLNKVVLGFPIIKCEICKRKNK